MADKPKAATRAADPPARRRAVRARVDSPSVVRLTVNIGPATQAALQHIVEREQVTVTEALRRLVSLGSLVDRKVTEEGKDLLLRSGDETQQVLIP
ncbi:hypothetical protein VSH64_37070 [Amycolatopsis rhabdoformis]|uniref:CopG family transcriptional regulator n=1 Tax=Amycolatopsis rhabdoformis TaxID=1448059 RepID=A0ABZ1I210_9PSEU|nr:hypothetical protein [Amycolatopsis rhabdoformis]WSE28408.1 hypothetical protein VSH64_37070 [Amycolatopsis rhabdoformis]